MNTTIFIFSIIALQVICWWVGRRSARGMTTQQDYYLGGRGFAFFPLMMTFLATQIGGGLVLGAAEESYSCGWWVLFYPLGQVVGLVALGAGIGKRLASYGVSTVAQIFEVAYSSPLFKRAVSILSIFSLFVILIAQVLASQKFMLSIGVMEPWLFYLFWGLVIAYTAMGGIRAVVATDMIQALFFLIVLFGAFTYAWWNHPLDVLPATDFPSAKLSGWFLMPLLYSFIEQDMGQRCFAARSNRSRSLAAIGAGALTLLFSFIPIYFGIVGNAIGIERIPGASSLMAAVIWSTSPEIAALVGCAVLAAVLSTADSLINAIGANLSQDFFQKSSLRITRMLSVAIGGGAVLLFSYFTNVVDLLIQSYEFSVTVLLVPLLAALFRKKPNLFSAVCAVGFGMIGFILVRFVPCPIPIEIAEILISFSGYLVGEGLLQLQARRAAA